MNSIGTLTTVLFQLPCPIICGIIVLHFTSLYILYYFSYIDVIFILNSQQSFKFKTTYSCKIVLQITNLYLPRFIPSNTLPSIYKSELRRIFFCRLNNFKMISYGMCLLEMNSLFLPF